MDINKLKQRGNSNKRMKHQYLCSRLYMLFRSWQFWRPTFFASENSDWKVLFWKHTGFYQILHLNEIEDNDNLIQRQVKKSAAHKTNILCQLYNRLLFVWKTERIQSQVNVLKRIKLDQMKIVESRCFYHILNYNSHQ